MTLEEMREKKREYGLTNEQISDYTGVPLATVQKIFAGVTESPRYTTLQALETLFRQLEGEEKTDVAKADRMAESLAYMADDSKAQGEYTLADYYALPDDRRVELIDGVIYDMSSPESIHQILITSIWKDLFNYISDRKGNCLPMIAPLDVQLDRDDRTMVQPDVLVKYPDNRQVIIDSKVSFTAYDNYMNASSDEERRRYARQHLESVYGHIVELSRKDYPARNSRSPEFVIMFVPIESMFMLALDEARAQGKNLWHDAYVKRVIIMTPTNLVLAVRMLQDMWRQQRLEANIRAIKERAEKIYSQFINFAVDIDAVRANIDKALASCDSARRRLTSGNNNLIGQFERMRHLGLEPKLPASASTLRTWSQMRDEALGTDDMPAIEEADGADSAALPDVEV